MNPPCHLSLRLLEFVVANPPDPQPTAIDDLPGLHINIWLPAQTPHPIRDQEMAAFVDAVAETVMSFEPRTEWDPHMSSVIVPGASS